MARILVAEDDAHVLRLMSMWLERNGHQVHEAHNGQQAMDFLSDQPVDLLVTDVNMPVRDGLVLVHWLRSEMRRDTPVIMLSARCDQDKIGASVAGLGVSICTKPFSPSRLIAEIERLLGARQPALAATEGGHAESVGGGPSPLDHVSLTSRAAGQ